MKTKTQWCELPIDQLVRGQYQPRRHFDPAALNELAESIKSTGIIQPLVVRPIASHRYEIIAGERRWRAAQRVGLEAVPCLVRELTDQQAAAVTTIENIQRQDLNPMEEASAYSRLVMEFGYYHEEVASIVGKSRSAITNSLRFLALDSRIQRWLAEKKLNAGHGKVIAGLPEQDQVTWAMQCIDQGWSVHALEKAIKKQQPTKTINSRNYDPDIVRLERVLSETLGAPVKFESRVGRRDGWLKIRYFDPETLAGLLDKMGIDYE